MRAKIPKFIYHLETFERRLAGVACRVKRTPKLPPVTDIFCSFEDRLDRLQRETAMLASTRVNVLRALERIDLQERDAILEKYRNQLSSATFGFGKYADFVYWAFRNVRRAEWLGLEGFPPLDILDIGMGGGNFGMVCQTMGHRFVGTDVRNPFYSDLCRLAGVQRIEAPVRRGEVYRPIDQRFDLITIMVPNFHRREVDGKLEYWPLEDWKFLLRGLARDLLKDNGRIYIEMAFDRQEDGTPTLSPLVHWSADRAARMDRFPDGGFNGQILFYPATVDTFA
jgi:hypothetical protein